MTAQNRHHNPDLRSAVLAGVSLGRPGPLSTRLLQLQPAAHVIHYNALEHSFLSVASELPLLHVPRIPFDDSIDVRVLRKDNRDSHTLWHPYDSQTTCAVIF